MAYSPDVHHRQSIRLKQYDYSSNGIYFVTICTQDRENLFGTVVNNQMLLNKAGEMIEFIYLKIPIKYKNIILYCWIFSDYRINRLFFNIPILSKFSFDIC